MTRRRENLGTRETEAWNLYDKMRSEFGADILLDEFIIMMSSEEFQSIIRCVAQRNCVEIE